jgi:exodeoxyribonuclease VII large subunit
MSKLLEQLVQFRDLQAKKEGVENYKVLQYKTIEEICRVCPKDLSELGKIKGIGPAKLKKYGGAILAMVAGVIPDSTSPNASEDAGNPESTAGAHGSQTARALEGLVASGMTQGEEEKQVISVGEYIDYLNVIFQKTADVKIQGEVSSAKEYPSGLYFTLKDKRDESVLSCFLPLYTYRGLDLPLEEGMEIRVEGMPRMVRRNGRFQFTVENVELAGEGALKKAYELLKKKLEGEGVFARKRELPECISRIGIITSRSGAVIHDFRNNVDQRGMKLYLKDVRVEGNQAVGQIVRAIRFFNANVMPGFTRHPEPGTSKVMDSRLRGNDNMDTVDVIVLMRGGGSLEDLQAFNNEEVVRTVFASNIPTIAAIGHDTDVPLVCLAADAYTSTPTAAAVLVNKSWNRVTEAVSDATHQLLYNYDELLSETVRRVDRLTDLLIGKLRAIFDRSKYITFLVESKVKEYITWVDRQSGFLNQVFGKLVSVVEYQLVSALKSVAAAEAFLASNSPERNLKLGYSILRTKDGKIITKVDQVEKGGTIRAQLEQGGFEANVTNIQEK